MTMHELAATTLMPHTIPRGVRVSVLLALVDLVAVFEYIEAHRRVYGPALTRLAVVDRVARIQDARETLRNFTMYAPRRGVPDASAILRRAFAMLVGPRVWGDGRWRNR